MFKSLIKHINHSKGKINLAFAKFHIWAFILSGILFSVAVMNAYSVYSEGKMAQHNAQELLKEFEQELLKVEVPQPIQKDSVLSKAKEDEEPIALASRTSKREEKSQIKSKPIAKLHIKKIGLSLSVLSQWSYDLLEISICKFAGPEPNEPGNFIIIGHNYLNGSHFGDLHLLQKGDLVELTDLTSRKKTYEVYEMLTINPDEVDKLATNESSVITLITCSSDGKVRLVVKCKEVI